jgi:hypothetical protein
MAAAPIYGDSTDATITVTIRTDGHEIGAADSRVPQEKCEDEDRFIDEWPPWWVYRWLVEFYLVPELQRKRYSQNLEGFPITKGKEGAVIPPAGCDP